MNASTKTYPARQPLFAADAFGSRQGCATMMETAGVSAARSLHSLVTVTPRVRDSLVLRCVFSRTASFFGSEPLHARRAH